jgi:hypothetical protein
LGISLPRIVAWCAEKNNPVGAEYILEEKAPGQPLGRVWQDWEKLPMASRTRIIEQIVGMESKLASTKFLNSGCIYFRDDISDGVPLATILPFESSVLKRFKLGPLLKSGMWAGERARVGMNRGPCE